MCYLLLTLAGSQCACYMSWLCTIIYVACCVLMLISFSLSLSLSLCLSVCVYHFASCCRYCNFFFFFFFSALSVHISPSIFFNSFARVNERFAHLNVNSHSQKFAWWLKYRYKCNRFWITLWPKAHTSCIYTMHWNVHSVQCKKKTTKNNNNIT